MIVSGAASVDVFPSDTDSRTVYDPEVAYVCAGLAAVDVVPSPNVQLYVRGWPSGSDDPALEPYWSLTSDGDAR